MAAAAVSPVLEGALAVWKEASHVSISAAAVEETARKMTAATVNEITSPKAFDEDLHFSDGGPLTAQYLLVVDALNFCFWPDPDLQYHHMSKGVKAAVLRDPSCISAERLSTITGAQVRDELFGWPRDLPQQEERARLLREVGSVLLEHFDGQAARLVEAAQGSAVRLVQLVAQYLPGFRDHAVYKGRQVFLYKRAQIFAGDLYGAFQGKGLGAFHDLHLITMFADYRVPVVLHVMGILQYSDSLKEKIEAKQQVPPGSEEEIEIRACTIVAVEQLRHAIARRFGAELGLLSSGAAGEAAAGEAAAAAGQVAAGGAGAGEAAVEATAAATGAAAAAGAAPAGEALTGPSAGQGAGVGAGGELTRGVPRAVQLDWWLWHEGERERERHPPHHRTLTIFY